MATCLQDAEALERRIQALEAELREARDSELAYRAAASLARRLVWTADPNGRLISMSPTFADLIGLPASRALAQGWRELVHPQDLPQVEAQWAHSIRTGVLHEVEFRARFADGSYRLLRSRAQPHRDEQGRITCWHGSSVDIHDRRAAEAALEIAEERYRLAAEATNDAIWDLDVAAQSITWTDMAARIFGHAVPLGTTSIEWWVDRIHPDERARVADSLQHAIDGDAVRWSASYRFRRHDGSYADVLDRGFIIRSGGAASRAVGAITDLTERNRAEAELRRMQAELLHVSRVSAMGIMASTLAHELNQPLTAVSNYVRGARRIAGKSEAAAEPLLMEALTAAEAGARRAADIVRRLRDFVSRGTVDIAGQDLEALVEEASLLALHDEASRRVRLSVRLDDGARAVKADRVQVQQVLVNLIRNAVEAMRGVEAPEITITSRVLPADLVEVRVADNGPGFAPEHKDSLFSHFMTTKAEGVGIGLPISRTIVEAHGGTIRAENKPGGGAVFCFTLPRHQSRAGKVSAL